MLPNHKSYITAVNKRCRMLIGTEDIHLDTFNGEGYIQFSDDIKINNINREYILRRIDKIICNPKNKFRVYSNSGKLIDPRVAILF